MPGVSLGLDRGPLVSLRLGRAELVGQRAAELRLLAELGLLAELEPLVLCQPQEVFLPPGWVVADSWCLSNQGRNIVGACFARLASLQLPVPYRDFVGPRLLLAFCLGVDVAD